MIGRQDQGWAAPEGVDLAQVQTVGAGDGQGPGVEAKAQHDAAPPHRDAGTPLPPQYHRLFRIWFALGWPAFIGVIAIFALMIIKP